jgi:CO/xanthine dehydrogenase Mo-binding subunit
VTLHNHYIGGGFGRRLEADMVASAVRVAKEVPTPIKVVWTREEDMRHDVYRPAYRDTISASLSNGKIIAWKYRVTGAVNPDTIMAQLQGGLIFGLTAALWGEVTIEKGRVQQSNFNNYRMLRIDETPPIDVHVIKSAEHPGGIGETGATAGPPALRNAIYAATGVPLHRLPIDRAAIAIKKA